MNSLDPARIAPNGHPKPLEKHTCTLSCVTAPSGDRATVCHHSIEQTRAIPAQLQLVLATNCHYSRGGLDFPNRAPRQVTGVLHDDPRTLMTRSPRYFDG